MVARILNQPSDPAAVPDSPSGSLSFDAPLGPVFGLIERALEERRQQGLYRADRVSRVSPLTDHSTNDYLAMSSHPEVIAAGSNAAARWGAGSRSSRLLGLSHDLNQAIEETARGWIPVDWAATFLQSGFSANLAVFDALVKTLTREGSTVDVIIDHEAHSSLFAGVRQRERSWKVLPFRHGDWAHLDRRLAGSTAAVRIVVVEALHSMNGTFADAERLGALCRQYSGTFLFVDEAHTFGLVDGMFWSFCDGIRQHLDGVLIGVMGGCGKAVGVSGGLLVTPHLLREACFQFSRPLIYSTSASPFVLGAVLKSLHILSGPEGVDRRRELQSILSEFESLIQNLGRQKESWDVHLGQCRPTSIRAPLAVIRHRDDPGHAQRLAALFSESGRFVPYIRPPTVPRGTERLRVSFSLQHNVESFVGLFSHCIAVSR
jgi:8-amino-7-oxononanoate synthase